MECFNSIQPQNGAAFHGFLTGSTQKIPKKGLYYELNKSKQTATVIGPEDKNLKKITIPAKIKVGTIYYRVTAVAAKAFRNCRKATEATIGKNVTSIGRDAFSGCRKLKKLTFKTKKLKTVGKNAFRNLNKALSVRCPRKVKGAYEKLLKKAGVPKVTWR